MSDSGPLVPGTRLGVYEVLASLGEGGMGVVYRARDTRLKRDVAIKVLLAEVASDPERIARFEREAQLLAALNHPHIAAIYGVEQAGDITALVMELVEGPTLADVIAEARSRPVLKPGAGSPKPESGLPLADALAIARQIAEALEAAHEQGIIHRDLKPANIKVKDDGTVKVLDFGLAKALDGAGGAGKAGGTATVQPASPARPALTSPTLTSPVAMTGVGVLLGTAAYMAPEQARGRAVDRRADIWAFGCVLFEMLTGERAFGGDDTTDTLAAIVRDTPDLTRVPPQVRRLLGKCLEKDPGKRLRAIGDWELLLDAPAPVAASQPAGRSRAPWIAAGVCAVLAAVFAAIAFSNARGESSDARPLVATLPMPEASSVAGFLALSPDGSQLAIRTNGDGGSQELWLRSLSSSDVRLLTKTGGPRAPFWSPDGRTVGFFADGKLKTMAAAGGPEHTLCDLPSFERGGSWSAKGLILFGSGGTMYRTSPEGGGCVPLASARPELPQEYPTFLPDGEHFFYLVRAAADQAARGIYLASLTEPLGRRLLGDVSSVLYAPPATGSVGHLLFRRGGALVAQPFDQERLALTGDPSSLADKVAGSPDRGTPAASVSANGVLTWANFASEGNGDTRLVWLDANGTRLGNPMLSNATAIALSPNGKLVIAGAVEPVGGDTFTLLDLERMSSSRFPRGVGQVWSPDSRMIVTSRDGDFYRRDVSTGEESLVMKAPNGNISRSPSDWSSDGRYLLYTEVAQKTRGDIWYLTDPLQPASQPIKFLATDADESQAHLSPDGRWVLYFSTESGGEGDVFLSPFPSGRGRWKVSTQAGSDARWSPDGRTIYFRAGGGGSGVRTYQAATFAVGRNGEPEIGVPRTQFTSPGGASVRDQNGVRMVPAADGRFLVSEFDAPPDPVINLVVNWQKLIPAATR